MWTVITGASSGIGEAVAEQLARLDYSDLLLISRRSEALEALAFSLSKITSKKIECLDLDVSSETCRNRFGQWLKLNPSAKNLVNSAGHGIFGETTKLTKCDFQSVVSTNLEGLYFVSQEFIKGSDPGVGVRTIVNVSSDADATGFPDASIYGASKGAVRALSRAWQSELRSESIRVCNLSPGRVDTHFNNKKPGMRPGALLASEVAEVIVFALTCSANIDLLQIDLESLSRGA